MIILPIETKRRELLSKLLIAFHLLKKGDSVIIGHDLMVSNAKNLIDNTILLKSAASFEAKKIDSLYNKKNIIISLDEEGIIPPINDPSINVRFNKDFLSKIQKVLVNGNLELELINKVYSGKKLIKTGNPRLDLCKKKYQSLYEIEVEKIKKITKNKDILLIASRFGDVNSHDEIDYFKLLEGADFIKDDKSREYFHSHYEHTKKIFKKFLTLPDFLAACFPDKMIVVRPHPSENISKWVFHDKNILVSNEFDIGSWIHSGITLIHNGCTTAVEASVRGNKIISYKPFEDILYDNPVADNLGMICKNEADIVNSIKRFNFEKVPSHVSSSLFLDDEIDAAELIANELSEYSNFKPYSRLLVPFKIRLVKLKNRLLSSFGSKTYLNSKFDSLTEFEITSALNKIMKVNEELFEVDIKKLANDCYSLCRK